MPLIASAIAVVDVDVSVGEGSFHTRSTLEPENEAVSRRSWVEMESRKDVEVKKGPFGRRSLVCLLPPPVYGEVAARFSKPAF